MVYFDLNIPYVEGGGGRVGGGGGKDKQKSIRVKLVVMAMELGYTGIAYNYNIHGVMADCHRCSISPLPLSSLLQLAPSISSVVQFHRKILKVPLDSPFRQYTRLTVTVNSMIQAASLNSGNPVLQTYDLVAVRPTNQATFEHACQKAHVDLIAIDFSEKLQFRLKSQMVKAAIQRGLYFELIYSPLLSDTIAKSELINGAKLLVGWTGGKNIILSSSASTVNELRGPYDVANLSTLLGLSMQHAKAAMSRNCRSLMTNVIRKKRFYKEAIRVEGISPSITAVDEDSLFGDWKMWDPISSGEGDLLLENELMVANCHDLEKGSSASGSNKIKEQVEALQCSSAQEFHGSQFPTAKGALQSCELRKHNDSLTSAQLSGHEHEDAFLVNKDSSLQQPSLLLPSESSLELPSHPSHENSAIGAWTKTSDVENNIQKIEVYEVVSSREDVSCPNVIVTAASGKVEGTISQAGGACPLDCGAGICINSTDDAVDSLAKRLESPFGISFDKQVTEHQILNNFAGGPSPIKCDNQNPSSFNTPLHMLESGNEGRIVDAVMDENLPTVSYAMNSLAVQIQMVQPRVLLIYQCMTSKMMSSIMVFML
ncbi:protein GAMETOPHYTE DEFECTIVE 1 isoform X2 [Nymphaea colorata]|uniref:protein GAMETOPHYTE DEFECTIVE 1 isoform X2 n=1 Tax=Nymphaea colorata TaxID=210225 RepID=UPI00129DCF16|nr:protein GAMETOPHYTE DEFECTIVE 1 isoform X2 [Nymphaea colorata]